MKLKKPSGAIVEVNERSIEYAKSLGWKPVTKATKKKAPKKAK